MAAWRRGFRVARRFVDEPDGVSASSLDELDIDDQPGGVVVPL